MSTIKAVEAYDINAIVAVNAVRESMEKRKYLHYVKPMIKISEKGMVCFSYLAITTDYNKAVEEGYTLPDWWLREQKQSVANRVKRAYVNKKATME